MYSGVYAIQLREKAIVQSPTHDPAASADLSTSGSDDLVDPSFLELNQSVSKGQNQIGLEGRKNFENRARNDREMPKSV